MRSRSAVSLPVAGASTGVVPAPSSGSIPPELVVVDVVVDEEGEYPPCGDDDLLELPQPATVSRAAAPAPMKKSLRMGPAY
jgi:hypothetical protein